MSRCARVGLEGHTLSYRLGQDTLLRDVSVAVRTGRVTAVLGANGAGKSTLLRLLSGDMTPTEGEVTLHGRELSEWDPRDVAVRRAVMPQASTLTFPFTAAQVAALGRIPHAGRRLSDEDHAIAFHALERAGAEHLSQRVYPTLSGGERQRVDFARAIAQVWTPSETGGRYLLLDEPTSSLDLARQHELLRGVRAFAATGAGVLVVLHDLNLAAEYADEVVVLHQGEVVASGTPAVALTAEVIEHAFALPVLVTTHPRSGGPLIVPDTHTPALRVSRE